MSSRTVCRMQCNVPHLVAGMQNYENGKRTQEYRRFQLYIIAGRCDCKWWRWYFVNGFSFRGQLTKPDTILNLIRAIKVQRDDYETDNIVDCSTMPQVVNHATMLRADTEPVYSLEPGAFWQPADILKVDLKPAWNLINPRQTASYDTAGIKQWVLGSSCCCKIY